MSGHKVTCMHIFHREVQDGPHSWHLWLVCTSSKERCKVARIHGLNRGFPPWLSSRSSKQVIGCIGLYLLIFLFIALFSSFFSLVSLIRWLACLSHLACSLICWSSSYIRNSNPSNKRQAQSKSWLNYQVIHVPKLSLARILIEKWKMMEALKWFSDRMHLTELLSFEERTSKKH